MSQFERRGEIFQEIERLQAEIDACPVNSRERLALLRNLNTALQAYNAVPSDETRRSEISARLDQLQGMEPTPECAEEFCSLCRELQTLLPRVPPKSIREDCWRMRGFIWCVAILFFLTAVSFAPMLSSFYTWFPAFCILGSAACFIWAIWSSTYKAV